MMNFLRGEPVDKAVNLVSVPRVATPVVEPTAAVISKEDTTMALDITKCYTADEIAKAKEKGIDLAKATEGMENFLKAIGMNFDWRGVGYMCLEFADAVKGGNFGGFPSPGVGTLLKSQPGADDQLAQIEKAMQDMYAQNQQTQAQMQQLAQAYEQIAKSRGQRQSQPGLPMNFPQMQVQEPEIGWNGIDMSPSEAKQILGL